MRQRGIISPDILLSGGFVLVLVIIFAAGFWYLDGERAEAFDAGRVAERLEWQERESAELAIANQNWNAALRRVRELEHETAKDLVALEEQHDREMANVQAERDRFMDDLAAGRVRFNPGITAACQGGSGRAADPTAATASERDAQARGELPPALRAAVAGGARLVTEADEVVAQLHQAQGLIESYRRACNRGET